MKGNVHGAYNIITDEMIICTKGNRLKRVLKYYRRIEENKSKWIFAHGKESEVIKKLMDKTKFYK